MYRAIKWSSLLFVGFVVVTQQVITNGPLIALDARIANSSRLDFPSWIDFIFMRIDDLGLRGLTATALMISAIYIARRFKTWRPLNLAVLSILALNLIVGLAKLFIGRTKPQLNVDLIYAGGLSYPSGHASNAILSWGVLAYLIYRYAHVNRYRGRLASAGVALVSLSVCVVSLIRNTHWLSDLVGGLFVGAALLVMVIAIDRFVASNSQLS
ncbi:MAG: phosphatase PAP2 family protein [Actinobacteria bacterium]|nr:phosphatase PAP2 family protein [Actinomycetota bacterium]MSX70002.1 phosphatase PAP2 family protein [Actinomycetota bacterium]MSY93200.1 phosphatase PAP2 family protein [Actinomycetota bacterium]